MLLDLLILVSARSIFNLIEILQFMSTYDIDYFNINIELFVAVNGSGLIPIIKC